MLRRKLMAGALALALVTTACGGDDDDASPDEPTADDATTDDEPAGDEPADDEPADDEPAGDEPSDDDSGDDASSGDEPGDEPAGDADGVLRYPWVAPTSLDPHKSSIGADKYVLYPMYDRLVHLSPNVEPVPGLATSWEFSDDGSYLELQLREGVVFQDGEPFDAEAVKANIERGQSLEGSSVAGNLAVIESVEVIDPLTVRFNLSGPAASLPITLANQPGMMISPAALDNPDLDQNPVGAGMYRPTSYEPGVKLTLEAWDEYWDQEAQQLGGMEIVIMPDFTARLNALRDDQLDAARLEPAQAAELESAGLNLLKQDSIEIGMLQLNRAKAPLDDVRVRQALNHAIDREAIVEGLFFGLGTPSVQIYPEGFLGHNPDVSADRYAYDPDRARELLAEAGLEDGFSMEINVAALDFVVAYAEAIQAQLGEIGVDVTVNAVELSQYGQVVYVDANGEGTAVIGAARPDPSETALQFQPGAFTNPGGASSPEVEALYQQSLDSTLTIEERDAVLQELSATLVEQAFAIVIFHPQNPWGFNDKVTGLQSWKDVIEFRGVGISS